LNYCYKCEWPCRSCSGRGSDLCVDCVDDHITTEQTHEKSGEKRRYPLFICERPKPLAPPIIVWSNMLKRIQLKFSAKMAPVDYSQAIKVFVILEVKRNRRLKAIDLLNKERSLKEEKKEVPFKSIELDPSGQNININLDFADNFESGKLAIEVTDYSIFKTSGNSMVYLQDLYLEIEDVSVFSTGNEDAITTTAESASSMFVLIMSITLIVSPNHGIAIIKVFQMADYFLYYNADTPANLAGFLQIFANTPLDYCPNPFGSKS